MSCNTCYEAIIESCNDIIIRANFPASTDLYWLIKKVGFNNLYQRKATTGLTGDLTILKSDLPAGFLISGGQYEIQIRDGANYLQPVTVTFGTIDYTCIIVKIVTITREEDDESETNVIRFSTYDIPDGIERIDGHEEFTGSEDLTITLAENYIPGSIRLYKNGARLDNASFNEATANTITLNVPRINEDEFIIDYKYLA